MEDAARRIDGILKDNPKAADADVVRDDDGLTFGDLRAVSRFAERGTDESVRAENAALREAISKALATRPRVATRYVGLAGMTSRPVVQFQGGDPYAILRKAIAAPRRTFD